MDMKKSFFLMLMICFSAGFVWCGHTSVNEEIIIEDMISEEVNDVPESDNTSAEEEVTQESYPGGTWQFIEDELLMVPGYLAKLSFVPRLITSALVCVGIREWRGGQDDHWLSKVVNDAIPGFICGSICAWTYETICYGYVLNKFLKNWEVNRSKTPQALHEFFDGEYELFCKGGKEYIFWNTDRVIKAISSVIECRDGRLEVSLGDCDEE